MEISRKERISKKFLPFAAAFAAAICALGLLLPVSAQAANTYNSIDITVELADDGSASITEVWDVDASEGTEFYAIKEGFDNEEITSFKVVDETGREFTDVGEWDVDRSFEEKAYQSGIVHKSDGYELCWGISSYGHHVYSMTYEITNVVKAFDDADGLLQTFLNDPPGTLQSVTLTITKPGTEFTTDNTLVWGAGMTGEVHVQDGTIQQWTTNGYHSGDSFETMAQFEKGMFHPVDVRSGTFEDVRTAALAGTDYETRLEEEQNQQDQGSGRVYNYESSGGDGDYTFVPSGSLFSCIGTGATFFPVLVMAAVAFGFVAFRKKSGAGASGGSLSRMKPEYKTADYSRELPFGGSMEATYARLADLSLLSSEGDVIGAYLLMWLRSRQVEISQQTVTKFFGGDKTEEVIKLYAARDGMAAYERMLYDMLLQAAGSDYLLQTKEFEKWSRKHYTEVQGWLTGLKNAGVQEMRHLGFVQTVPTKVLFFTMNKTEVTPAGDDATVKMFGFKKYLQDFTIINEREAREVQLWDRYLVFAQMFGIADAVAQQFKNLYPGYFQQLDETMGTTNMSMLDWMILSSISRDFGRAMSRGYHAGLSAAQSSYSGGGGSTSSGGFSGGSFGGGGSFGSR